LGGGAVTGSVWIIKLVRASELKPVELHEPREEGDKVEKLLVGLWVGDRKVRLPVVFGLAVASVSGVTSFRHFKSHSNHLEGVEGLGFRF